MSNLNKDLYVKNRYLENKDGVIWALTKQLYTLKRKAILNNIAFDISMPWVRNQFLAQEGLCSATGIPFSFEKYSPYEPYIDIVDCGLGYTMDNCRVVVAIFGRAKSCWSDKDVLNMSTLYLKHHKASI